MDEKRLKVIIETHSPQMKAQPTYFLNQKLNDSLQTIAKARKSKGTATQKEERIIESLRELHENLKYVAEPAITCPMETCILLRQIKWDFFDLGLSERIFQISENKTFFIKVEEAVNRPLNRIAPHHSIRAMKISELLRLIRFLPSIQNQIAFQEKINAGMKFKWTALFMGIVFSLFIAVGIGKLQAIIPGIFVSIAAYLFVSITSSGAGPDPDDAPGGFNRRYRYLSPKSRRAVRNNCHKIFEDVIRTYRWRTPTTFSQVQELRHRAAKKIRELANPNTKVILPEPETAAAPNAEPATA